MGVSQGMLRGFALFRGRQKKLHVVEESKILRCFFTRFVGRRSRARMNTERIQNFIECTQGASLVVH